MMGGSGQQVQNAVMVKVVRTNQAGWLIYRWNYAPPSGAL
jgi:hypothetical protein